MSDAASTYWQQRYTDPEGLSHHARQNYLISRDFLIAARGSRHFIQALKQHRIIEIGCGTGELAVMIQDEFDTRTIVPTDFSRPAIAYATKRHPEVFYRVLDVLKDNVFADQFDLAISSNTLEHFKDWKTVVDRMLRLAPRVILIIPYRQKGKDGYDAEGGAGHVTSFSKASFKNYKLVEALVFKTAGWQHRGGSEEPRQLAVLLEKKYA